MCYHAQLIFVEMGFRHVVQADLKLLTASDLPTSASRSAGIIGVSHHPQPREMISYEKESCMVNLVLE